MTRFFNKINTAPDADASGAVFNIGFVPFSCTCHLLAFTRYSLGVMPSNLLNALASDHSP